VRSGWRDKGGRRRWLDRLGAGSGMGREVAAFAWDRTPLGDPSSWPVELRALVQLCLTTRFPMLVTWGPQLSMIYNDGYREMIGDKHPEALGAPLAVVWAEIWDVIGPIAEEVMATGEPTWSELQRFLIDRRGFVEEMFFTFSYSPAFDAHGRAMGLVDVATEMTGQVVSQRRLVALAGLGEAVYSASQVTGVCLAAVAELAVVRNDVVNADVFLRVGDEPVLIASTRRVEARSDHAVAPAQGARWANDRASEARGRDHAGAAGGRGRAPRRQRRRTERRALRGTGPDGGVHGRVPGVRRPGRSNDQPGLGDRSRPRRRVGRAASHQRDVATGHAATGQRPSNHCRPVSPGSLEPGGRRRLVRRDRPRRAPPGHGRGRLCRTRPRGGNSDGPTAQRNQSLAARASRPGNGARTPRSVLGFDPRGVRHQRGWLDGAGGSLLQVEGEHGRPLARVDSADGDLLMLYTDGLVERRGQTIDDGLDRLAAAAGRWFERGAGAAETADGLLRELLQSRGDDDVVLVVKQLVIDRPDCT
jgi:hypothetical protein